MDTLTLKEMEKRLALCLSLIFPGIGLVFKKEYWSGIIFAVIHLTLGYFLLKVMIISTHNSGGGRQSHDVDFILITLFLINYLFSAILSWKSRDE
ncbi:hypothetical protein [Paenibacillus lemnae]|uniref:DUF5683 domain-containing protein n=1 Tax=Paenibacillus lemnae TaxID=1330551 RepID=A0A848MCF8_PAELE|nr:hypothetical protein [Paenibacillus lemnae]NMO97124.1 hypothetical protein [Paenibacillus lemnae]